MNIYKIFRISKTRKRDQGSKYKSIQSKTYFGSTSKPKTTNIQDLQNEISQIKLQIRDLIIQNEGLDIRLQKLENHPITFKQENKLETVGYQPATPTHRL